MAREPLMRGEKAVYADGPGLSTEFVEKKYPGWAGHLPFGGL
jgi:hypothetical protein